MAATLSAQDSLRALSDSIERVTRHVTPSVVQILVTGYGPLEDSSGEASATIGKQRSIGSGVIIDPDGYIITNAHVVKGAQRLQVVSPATISDVSPMQYINARTHTWEAKVVGIAEEIDLALLHIDAHKLPALPIGNYDKLRQGELVLAFGNPEGLQNTVTMGLVSSVLRQPDPDSPLIFIQTDAPINPGNSGGPLVNVDGEIVGINTFILTQSGGNQGLGFAIPSAIVGFAFPQLKKYGHIHRGEIGVTVQSITPTMVSALNLSQNNGVIISDVIPGSPAASANLKIGDIVVSVDGKTADSLPLFTYALFTHNPGDRVKLNVLRGRDQHTLEIPMVERKHDVDRLVDFTDPEKNLIRRLGILAIEIDEKIATLLPSLREPTGIIVAARSSGSASENPLLPGDVIHAINGSPVSTIEGLRRWMDTLKPESPAALQIERDGSMTYLTFQLE